MELLLLSLLVTAAPSSGAAPLQPARERLRQVCEARAWNPHVPWAVAHGVIAFGRGWQGGLAVELLGAQAHRDADGLWTFDPALPSGQPLATHPGLVVKTLLAAGVDPRHRFHTADGAVTVGMLERDLEQAFPYRTELRELPWVLEAIALTHRPGQRVSTRNGPVSVDGLFDAALATLERDGAALSRGLSERAPSVPKNEVALSEHPCGGLHLVQALAVWARSSQVRRRWGERWRKQEALLRYRAGSEERQYDAAMTSTTDRAEQVVVLAQKLKFEGHWLETMRLIGGHRDEQLVAWMRGQLAGTVAQLERLGVWSHLTAGDVERSAFARDLVGDACHALAALDE